jgi:two-component system chemotaxis response regulator CheB
MCANSPCFFLLCLFDAGADTLHISGARGVDRCLSERETVGGEKAALPYLCPEAIFYLSPDSDTRQGGDDLMPANQEQGISAHFANAAYDLVALAASAGGLTALSLVLSNLPAEFPAAVVLVQHLDPRHRSLMAEILGRRTSLQVKQAEEGDRLQPSTVYIAPPDRHLLVNPDGSLSLSQSELVHFVRPSADLLFESVAASYRERAIAVVLTGTGSDGNMGVQAIKKMGGTVIAQDEQSAEFFGMPQAAIQTGSVDFILSLDEIAPALVTLVMKGGEIK